MEKTGADKMQNLIFYRAGNQTLAMQKTMHQLENEIDIIKDTNAVILEASIADNITKALGISDKFDNGAGTVNPIALSHNELFSDMKIYDGSISINGVAYAQSFENIKNLKQIHDKSLDVELDLSNPSIEFSIVDASQPEQSNEIFEIIDKSRPAPNAINRDDSAIIEEIDKLIETSGSVFKDHPDSDKIKSYLEKGQIHVAFNHALSKASDVAKPEIDAFLTEISSFIDKYPPQILNLKDNSDIGHAQNEGAYEAIVGNKAQNIERWYEAYPTSKHSERSDELDSYRLSDFDLAMNREQDRKSLSGILKSRTPTPEEKKLPSPENKSPGEVTADNDPLHWLDSHFKSKILTNNDGQHLIEERKDGSTHIFLEKNRRIIEAEKKLSFHGKIDHQRDFAALAKSIQAKGWSPVQINGNETFKAQLGKALLQLDPPVAMTSDSLTKTTEPLQKKILENKALANERGQAINPDPVDPASKNKSLLSTIQKYAADPFISHDDRFDYIAKLDKAFELEKKGDKEIGAALATNPDYAHIKHIDAYNQQVMGLTYANENEKYFIDLLSSHIETMVKSENEKYDLENSKPDGEAVHKMQSKYDEQYETQKDLESKLQGYEKSIVNRNALINGAAKAMTPLIKNTKTMHNIKEKDRLGKVVSAEKAKTSSSAEMLEKAKKTYGMKHAEIQLQNGNRINQIKKSLDVANVNLKAFQALHAIQKNGTEEAKETVQKVIQTRDPSQILAYGRMVAAHQSPDVYLKNPINPEKFAEMQQHKEAKSQEKKPASQNIEIAI
jgi:hypothetical protein